MFQTQLPNPRETARSGEQALRDSSDAWRSGLHAIGAGYAIRALQLLPRDDAAAGARAEYWVARHLQALGELDRALAHATHGLEIADPRLFDLCADLHCMAALCLSELGDQGAGAAQAELALRCGVAHDSPRIQSVALARLGLCRWRQGDIPQAESILFRALSFAREANCPEEVVAAMSGLVGVSIAAYEQGHASGDAEGERAALARAGIHAERSVRTALREGDRASWLRSLNNQAKCLTLSGRLREAEATLRTVIEQADARGLRLLSMRARYNLALTLIDAARGTDAVAALEALLAMLDETEHLPLRRACGNALETATAQATARAA